MRRRNASKGAGGGLLTAAVLGVLTLSGTAAVAQEKKPAIPGTFSGNVALTSEYYFRGLSQTDDAPALQGGFDYEVKVAEPVSIYAGVWGSNVDFNEADGIDGATVEIDWYGGLKGAIGATGISWDLGFIYYSYPGADGDLDYDFIEAKAALGYDFGVAAVTASINYSPDYTAGSGDAFYPKLAVDVPVPGVEGLSFSGYVAYQDVEKNDVFGTRDYVEWNISATYNLLGFDLSLAYTDTDIGGDVDGKNEAILFTVARSF
jgi:uncharacterized protein (TIGR02001 family)